MSVINLTPLYAIIGYNFRVQIYLSQGYVRASRALAQGDFRASRALAQGNFRALLYKATIALPALAQRKYRASRALAQGYFL